MITIYLAAFFLKVMADGSVAPYREDTVVASIAECELKRERMSYIVYPFRLEGNWVYVGSYCYKRTEL